MSLELVLLIIMCLSTAHMMCLFLEMVSTGQNCNILLGKYGIACERSVSIQVTVKNFLLFGVKVLRLLSKYFGSRIKYAYMKVAYLDSQRVW